MLTLSNPRTMTNKEIEKEFELLSEYLDVFIQLLPYYIPCGGKRISKGYMLTFEEYKNDRASFLIPFYKESKDIYDGKTIVPAYTHGIGASDGIAHRFYNFWKFGCKYFTGGNISGDFIINNNKLNPILKIVK